MKNTILRNGLWMVPLSLVAGAWFASVQPGNPWRGLAVFTFLFLFSLTVLLASIHWAGGGKSLAWMVALAFALRVIGGTVVYLALPVYGYVEDEDQRAGFAYTDAHRRDDQAWELAVSDKPIVDAFSKTYAYDQYGGLLAFSAWLYRTLSPDSHRVLMLVVVSALMGAVGIPFLWKAAVYEWGEKIACASSWIFALYPESILLGGSAMREPFLLAFSAFALWGFISWKNSRKMNDLVWLGVGIAGMLLVSPSIALVTLVILGGWLTMDGEGGRFSWRMGILAAVIFIAGLFVLSSALNRQGNLGDGSPLGIIQNFIREAFKWNATRIEVDSGWVQKLFDQMPEWMRLPFVMIYGLMQPVLPAILFAPTTVIWKVIGYARSLGWYAVLPLLLLSFGAGSRPGVEKKRSLLLLWLTLVVWGWACFTALRGGGDQWDNPRYRLILFLWQAILAGNTLVWWRETSTPWLGRVVLMELVFITVFGQWYANRYMHIGIQLPFAAMVLIILGAWGFVAAVGIWRDRKRPSGHGV